MKNFWIIAALAIVLIAPLALRPKGEDSSKADRTLVIITPHNEATRYEFSRAFEAYYFKKTGKHVHIDWRTPGGTSEISRYLDSQFLASSENYWTNVLHLPWTTAVQAAFKNPRRHADKHGQAELEIAIAMTKIPPSKISCGIDLFFGGGSFDFISQAKAGHLVDSGVIAKHPEIFNDKVIPKELGGEPYWEDPQNRWVGACLASFGICYNTDVLRLLKIDKPPEQWSDLTDPRYFGQLALANPTQSGSVAKAFEMLIQQMMLACVSKISDVHVEGAQPSPHEKDETAAMVAQGWSQAMNLIQKISANARYFTDSGTKVPFDVDSGDAAAGMCIDFYGRFQSEAARKPDGSSRMQYITPRGGSSVGVDPIGMFRGAPNADVAREFIEFVISLDGQKLWNWKIGTPGGPVKYALRRLPVRPELYAAEFTQYRSDPEVQPYEQANAFQYHAAWTSPYFRSISFIVRAMCIDPHEELREAWGALIAAHFPPEATKTFLDVSLVDYPTATGPIRDTLRSPDKIQEVKLAKTLSESFRAQYRKAAQLAREGK